MCLERSERNENIYEALRQSKNVKGMESKLALAGEVVCSPAVKYTEDVSLTIVAKDNINNVSSLKTENNDCFVSELLMKEYGWEVGEAIMLNLYYYQHEQYNQVKMESLDMQKYRIAGSIKETFTEMNKEVQILLPLDSVQQIFHKTNTAFYVNSLFFYVADPLKLNDFKEEMKSYKLLAVIPEAEFSTQGNAMKIKDTNFILAATSLKEEETLLQGFLPVVIILVVFIGYVTSSLLIQSRKNEFRLMRIMGITKNKVVLALFLEQLFLLCAGMIIGMMVAQIVQKLDLLVRLVAGGLGLSYCLGTLAALWRISLENMMENKL